MKAPCVPEEAHRLPVSEYGMASDKNVSLYQRVRSKTKPFSKFCLSSAGLQNGRQIVFLSQFMHVKGPSDGVGVGVGGMMLAIVQASRKATQ